MLIASVSDFRKNIKSYLDKVSKNFETLIINRGKDSGIVIIVGDFTIELANDWISVLLPHMPTNLGKL